MTKLTKLLLSASAEGYHPAPLSRGNGNSGTDYEIYFIYDHVIQGTDPL